MRNGRTSIWRGGKTSPAARRHNARAFRFNSAVTLPEHPPMLGSRAGVHLPPHVGRISSRGGCRGGVSTRGAAALFFMNLSLLHHEFGDELCSQGTDRLEGKSISHAKQHEVICVREVEQFCRG